MLGSGGVYVIDPRGVTFSNLAEAASEETLSVHHVKMHVLSKGDCFDLVDRQPAQRGR
jgi:cyanophycinase